MKNLLLKLSFSVFLSCITNLANADQAHREQSIYTAAAFGRHNQLWRISPQQNYMVVDYSTNKGLTFSHPVRVNSEPQNINVWDENTPSISVDKQGKVYVLYSADDKQKSTVFFSQSNDGKHFSDPIKISLQADLNYHYQAEMLVAKQGKVHFLWHDVRDRNEYKQQGGGDLSIYYTSANTHKNIDFLSEFRIAKNICSCCRTAMVLDNHDQALILARFVFPDQIRDLGLIKPDAKIETAETWRVSFDNWKLEGCPTQGPALSISKTGRYHMAWFTLGSRRQGLFYAWSDDQGKTFSNPLSFGNPDKLPARAEVLAIGKKVALIWKEFDGIKTQIMAMHSENQGLNWSAPTQLAETESLSSYPALLDDGHKIYLSWNSMEHGFRLLAID
ncbi:sialidase family protein [Methylomonas sp. AM2-LC]|uniref:sialidase family protein n=1 Tax=Methylomonas sp. AM2-LC TaxID=3153301 RepID=UPI003267F33C